MDGYFRRPEPFRQGRLPRPKTRMRNLSCKELLPRRLEFDLKTKNRKFLTKYAKAQRKTGYCKIKISQPLFSGKNMEGTWLTNQTIKLSSSGHE
jgi:hypothetical protein